MKVFKQRAEGELRNKSPLTQGSLFIYSPKISLYIPKEHKTTLAHFTFIKLPFSENGSSGKLSINHIFWLITKRASTYGERWLTCFFYKLILGWCLYQKRHYIRPIHIHNFLKQSAVINIVMKTATIYRAWSSTVKHTCPYDKVAKSQMLRSPTGELFI